jgi:hypothetical protein
MSKTDEYVSPALLAYYWGEPWAKTGNYLNLKITQPDDYAELMSLQALINSEANKAYERGVDDTIRKYNRGDYEVQPITIQSGGTEIRE